MNPQLLKENTLTVWNEGENQNSSSHKKVLLWHHDVGLTEPKPATGELLKASTRKTGNVNQVDMVQDTSGSLTLLLLPGFLEWKTGMQNNICFGSKHMKNNNSQTNNN